MQKMTEAEFYDKAISDMIASDAQAACALIINMGKLCENGDGVIPPNLDVAFTMYKNAASLGSPEGFYHLSRICLSKCRLARGETNAVKSEMAVYAREAFPPYRVDAIRQPEIAYNIGKLFEHVGQHAHLIPALYDTHACEYSSLAAEYFYLGSKMPDVCGTGAPALCAEALENLQRQGYGNEFRPVFEGKTVSHNEPHP